MKRLLETRDDRKTDMHRFWLAYLIFPADAPPEIVRYNVLPFLCELIERIECAITRRWAGRPDMIHTNIKCNPRTTPVEELLCLLDADNGINGSLDFVYMGREYEVRRIYKIDSIGLEGERVLKQTNNVWIREGDGEARNRFIGGNVTLSKLIDSLSVGNKGVTIRVLHNNKKRVRLHYVV